MAQRLLILDFDSVRQRQRFAEAGSAASAVDQLVGQLRVALLVNASLVFTDVMVVDGEFFRSVTPTDLAAALGCAPHRIPFVVYSKDKTLAAALARREANPKFSWQTAKASNESPERRHTIECWLSAAQAGWFSVEPFPADHLPFTLPAPSSSVLAALSSDAARALLSEVAALIDRSDAVARLANERTSSQESSKVAPADLDEIDRWYQGAYLQAVANSNDAQWMSFEPPAATSPTHPRRTWRVSTRLVDQTRDASPVVFALAVARTEPLRARFAERQTGTTLWSIVYGALSASPSASHLFSVIGGIALRLVVALGTIVVAVVGEGTSAHSWGWVVGGLGLVVLSTIPWADLGTIRDIYRLHTGATVSVGLTRVARE